MEHLKEENKNLMNIRNNLTTMIVVMTGGMFWLASTDFVILIKMLFIPIGIYLDFLFLFNIIYVNNKINENIGEIKNECK